MQRKGSCLALLVGMQTGAAALENSVQVPQKLKNRTTLWPRNPTSECSSEGGKNTGSKTSVPRHSLQYYSQKPRVHEGVTGHIHGGILFSHKKEILSFAITYINLGNVVLTNTSQTEEGNPWIISPPMWTLKKQNSKRCVLSFYGFVSSRMPCKWDFIECNVWDRILSFNTKPLRIIQAAVSITCFIWQRGS